MGRQGNGDLSLAYPGVAEGHRVSADTIAARMQATKTEGIIGLGHAYGPTDDMIARFEALWRASSGNIELNRYAFLSEAKIEALSASVRKLIKPAPKLMVVER